MCSDYSFDLRRAMRSRDVENVPLSMTHVFASPLPRLKSPEDARFQEVHALVARKVRDQKGLFFAEGLRFVAQAASHQAAVEAVLLVPKMLTHPLGHKLLRQMAVQGVPIWETTPELFLRLSRAEEPQWIGAVVRQRWESLDRAASSPGLCWVALDQVQSPGNLGTILRTGDAVGASGLILIGDAVDPFDPGCVRATMGAVFAQRFIRASPEKFAVWKRLTGCQLIGTSPHAKEDYRATAYPAPTVLFMGGEKKGLSPEMQRLCDTVVRIPMVGSSDSLNLAAATSVMLYEVFNQRRGS